MTLPLSTKRHRIGVFGGAFDPPHRAHQALVASALTELSLDQLHVVPTGQAWHKPRHLTAAAHRLAMARLAFAPWSQVKVDDLEINRPGVSYTVDTLRELGRLYPQVEWFLIMGADQASALTTWREWQEIVQLATICVAFRADSTSAHTVFEAQKLFPERFLQLNMPAMPLSATQIRATLGAGQSADGLVTEAVARYIADHHLYHSH
ncbi:nicotinate (nicotinamide) nucleotide adenylyltransferase [Rhodoferax sp.]|uniref:nicotinate (nicotinamide) nucleotide adenylyltransferase n=1 Tax=Rhodoferax sp. TaxID=50421 RepID=UPI0026223B78|nr:nicotinate (nicotinamide) nucleotide adenylyltransferase [Rhodoferax sp.]MDD5478690.1 nicotinate (nicotinamide) nucleotide adenylyltransferase [Rhodoferax sp.]